MEGNSTVVFWLIFAALLFIIIYCDMKYNMLRDASINNYRPYSWGRVQLAWWMLLVLSSFIMIMCCTAGHPVPTFDSSTLVLLGITTGTTAAGRLIDMSNQKNAATAATPAPVAATTPPAKPSFFLDILSDDDGVTLHRLQAVIFNFVFGIWFINFVLTHFGAPCADLAAAAALPGATAADAAALKDCLAHTYDHIIPVISQNNLILLGLSSATYAVLKTTEKNNSATPPPAAGQVPAPAPPPPAPAAVPAPAQQEG